MPVLTDLAERIPGGFLVYEAGGGKRILHANRTLAAMFGCRDAEDFLGWVGGSFRGLVHPGDLEAVERSLARQTAESGARTGHVAFRIRRKDGQPAWVAGYGHLVSAGQDGELCYCSLYDVTAMKQAEEEGRLASEALQSEKRLNDAKNRFIFNLSHDIRTPMNAVIGYAGLAARHLDDPGTAARHLERVATAARHMLALIDGLLELAEADAGPMRLNVAPHRLASVIEDALDMGREIPEEKGIVLESDLEEGGDEVMVDANRLMRAIGSLLANAVKFTPQGGRIAVAVKRGPASDSGWVRYAVAVEDSGCGMDPNLVKRAFGAFERGETSTQSGHAGTGIGLSVVKRIVDAMGGSIAVESQPGQGSRFTLHLPLKLADHSFAAPQLAEAGSAAQQGRGRVLVVEDIEINRLLAQTLLEEAGYTVDAVADGCDAVEVVANSPEGWYTAVVMDIQMPVMNGCEAARIIRGLPRGDAPALPIIALSANAREEDRRQSLESGMNAHLAKPLDIDELAAEIERAKAARASAV